MKTSTAPIWLACLLACLQASILATACTRVEPSPQPLPNLLETAAPIPAAPPTPTAAPTLAPRYDGAELPAHALINIVDVIGEPVGIHRPAAVWAEIAGWDMVEVRWLVGQAEQDGYRMYAYEDAGRDLGIPGGDGILPDGIHELMGVWPGTGSYLTDGEQGEFVLAPPSEAEPGKLTVAGTLTTAGETAASRAVLEIDARSGLVLGVVETGRDAPLEQDRRLFRPDIPRMSPDGMVTVVPGTAFDLSNGLQLGLARRPLPDGTYAVGYAVALSSGAIVFALRDIAVNSEGMDERLRAVLDPVAGFRVLLPAEWSATITQPGRVTAIDSAGDAKLTVVAYSQVQGASALQFASRILDDFGPVEVLYEDEVSVGGLRAQWTAYAYPSGFAERRGVLIAMVRAGTGWAIDVDGPSDHQHDILKTARAVVETWEFLEHHDEPGQWLRMSLDALDLSVPTASVYREQPGGWQQLVDLQEGSIVSLYSVPGGDDPDDAAALWLHAVHEGVAAMRSSQPYTLTVGSRTWQRVDFSYTRSGGSPAEGMLLTGQNDLFGLLFWAEAPAAAFAALELDLFLPITADVTLDPTPRDDLND
jgi:hypothetical protein